MRKNKELEQSIEPSEIKNALKNKEPEQSAETKPSKNCSRPLENQAATKAFKRLARRETLRAAVFL